MRRAYCVALTVPLLAAVVTVNVEGQEPSPAVQASSPESVHAAPPGPFQGGFGGMIVLPVGEFHNNVEIAGGISGHLGVALGGRPVSLGIEATYINYGNEDRQLPVGGLPNLTVGVNTSNDVFLFHGRVRMQKLIGRVRPYFDGLVGFSYLTTTTNVDAKEYCSAISGAYVCTDNGDSVTNLDDLVFSGGGGAGMLIGLGKSGRVKLDLSLRYLYGARAKYLTEGGISWLDNAPPVLRQQQSRTDMLFIYIGIAGGR